MADRDYQHSRILDVHRWSEHPESNLFVDEIYETYIHQKNNNKNIQKKHLKVVLLDLYIAWLSDPELDLTSILETTAAKAAPSDYMRMNSGAGHDARTFSAIMPSSMMFVPSIGGLSHHYNENTSDEHIKLGAKVYSEAAIAMISSENVGC